ncbi:hypothetical protein CR513_23182, partial [Mucuna pruriens]
MLEIISKQLTMIENHHDKPSSSMPIISVSSLKCPRPSPITRDLEIGDQDLHLSISMAAIAYKTKDCSNKSAAISIIQCFIRQLKG